jgi:signal transduction histidine kinase
MPGGRQTSHAVRIERQSVIVLLVVIVPILAGLLHWLNQTTSDRVYLGGIAEAFVDGGGALSIADVMANAADLFAPATGSTANLGVRASPDSAFWVRLKLAPVRASVEGIGKEQVALSFEEPRFRRVDLYVADRQGQMVQAKSFVRDARTGYRFPVFFLPSQIVEADIAYARIVTGSSMRATLYLAPARVFERANDSTIIAFGLLLGTMTASAAYLLSLGTVLRNVTYLSLGVAILSAGLYVASDQALLETYLLPGAVTLSRATSLASTVFFYGAFLSFSVRFLRFGPHSMRLRRCVDVLAVFILAVALMAWIDGIADAGLLRRYLPYVGLASAALLVGLMLACARYAFRRALLFAIMWLPLLITGLSRVLLDTRPAEAGPVALNGVYFGFAISLLLFAVVTPLELYRRELMLRQRAQSLLARLESFAHIGRDIYFEADHAGQLVYLTGVGANAAAPEDDMTLEQAVVGGLPPRALDAVAAAQASASSISNHIFPMGENADLRWFSISGEPADDTRHFRGIVRDVTTEIEQENLRHQERHLISLGSLAATVAHEINNVVQPIINMSKGLRDHTRNIPAAERMLDLIDLASQQAARLVSQILKVGARSADQAAVPRHPIDLAVRDAVETLRLILPASLILEAHSEAIDDVTAKPGDILQILINLVANARRASGDAGTILIELKATADGACLSVTDHGEGMNETTLQCAAEPHFTTKPEGRAAGIGLGVVKRLVEEHGGRLSITSQQGKGTSVDLVFPRDIGENS